MNFENVADQLREAILADLKIEAPPYYLKVMEDVGGVTVQLFDTRESGGPYPEGKYVSGHIIEGWHDMLLEQKAKEAADAMRGDLPA